MSEESNITDGSQQKSGRWRLHFPHISRRGGIFMGVTAAFGIAATAAALHEVRNSRLQHYFTSRAAKQAAVTIVPANSNAPAAKAPAGPYDRRNGYTDIDKYSSLLAAQGYPLTARASSETPSLMGIHLYPPYKEKTQTGLSIVSADTNEQLYRSVFPRQVYPDYESIPPILVQSLLYAENRELLDPHPPTWNPAIEWDRSVRALGGQLLAKMGIHWDRSGGSSAATQDQKNRHSTGGVTHSATDKARQMLSASTEATLYDNPSQQITLDYINSAPFASYKGFGEVIGFADAMQVWFGEDIGRVNSLLKMDQSKLDDQQLYEVAKVFREAFSLARAVKKPTDYLQKNPQSLQDRVDAYLPKLVEAGIITPRFAAAVKAVRVEYADPSHIAAGQPLDKSVQALRLELLRLLKVPDGLYGMDRMDITVKTTEDAGVSQAIMRTMNDLANPDKADALGFVGYQLLKPGTGHNLSFAVTLMERLKDGTAVVRAQTDNFNGPLNLNEGIKLELGSTAKPLTAYLYFKAVAELREKFMQDPEAFKNMPVNANDHIALWAKDYFLNPDTDKSLNGAITAAMQRKYSGSPAEIFYTAGGQHVFENFERKENGQEYTVEQALVHSVNLCFIRIMRDVENYNIDQKMHVSPDDYKDLSSPLRRQLLEEFAEFEGGQFLNRAWEEQDGRPADEVASLLAAKSHRTPGNLAVIYRATHPHATSDELKAFIVKEKGGSEGQDFSKYDNYDSSRFNLNDLIFLSSLKNPFDYWLAAYKAQHPQATRQEAFSAAMQRDSAHHSVTLEMYKWMLRPDSDGDADKHKEIREGLIKRQNLNIQTILEQHAFRFIQKDLKEIGYPFADIVASYASSIAMGNTPKALSEFMGIIGSGGLRTAPIRFSEISMAEGTPYARYHKPIAAAQVRVMPVEIANALKQAMTGVVSDGTARRAYQSIKLDDGHILTIYGKTGTGDNRVGDEVKNRTATFMFNIDDRFYGTVLAYVDGPEAKDYKFTSALAAQLFKIIVNTPEVHDFLNRSYGVKPAQVAKADTAPKRSAHLDPAPTPR